jgi:hypothetical protein
MISYTDYIKEMHESIKSSAKEMPRNRKKKYENQINGSNSNFTIRTEIFASGNADKEKVDLVVVGSVGLSGISKIRVLGSVSRAIVEMASCPVLIVH